MPPEILAFRQDLRDEGYTEEEIESKTPPEEEWSVQSFGSLLIDNVIVNNLNHYLWLYEQKHGSISYLSFKTKNNTTKILMLILCTKFEQSAIDYMIKSWQEKIAYERKYIGNYLTNVNQIYLNFSSERLIRVYYFEDLAYSDNLNLNSLISTNNFLTYIETLANRTLSLTVNKQGAYAIGIFDLIQQDKLYWYRLENYAGEGKFRYKYTDGLNFFLLDNQVLNTPVIDIGLNLNNQTQEYANNVFTLYADLVLDENIAPLIIV
jgi:hypothetical protein